MYQVFYTIWDSLAGVRNSEVLIGVGPDKYARINYTDAGGGQGTCLNGSDVVRLEPGNSVSVRVWETNGVGSGLNCMIDGSCHFGIVCLYRL